MNDKKMFVTDGADSNLPRYLCKDNQEIVVDDLSTDYASNIKNYTVSKKKSVPPLHDINVGDFSLGLV